MDGGELAKPNLPLNSEQKNHRSTIYPKKFNLEHQVEDFLEKASLQLNNVVYQPKITKWDEALKFIAHR